MNVILPVAVLEVGKRKERWIYSRFPHQIILSDFTASNFHFN